MPSLRERFVGCLTGLAVGDALGGLFEAQSPERIRSRFSSSSALINHPTEEMWYTDDTQMAIGLAESLIARGTIDEPHLCQAFVANYHPSRGYGRGARAVLDAMEDGRDHHAIAEKHFPGGSYGNGGAMRVAPLGVFFHDDLDMVAEQARLSALPTHVHALGIEGTQLLALAAALATRSATFDGASFFDELMGRCKSVEYRERLTLARRVTKPDELPEIGNGIEAIESVPTAIACFTLTPNSYVETITNAIFLGGDTDTIAAMAGAISGAYLGVDAIPASLVAKLEDSPKGRQFIPQLAERLHEAHETRKGS